MPVQAIFLCAFAALAAAEPRAVDLTHGWRVLQDVHEAGEQLGVYRRDWNPDAIGPAMSGWEPIPRLAHLQLLLAPQPYFGRELRYFNQAPWWYRLEFPTPAGARYATLRFEGVDYYSKVWLNGELLGEHEGYSDPFEFEVGPRLSRDQSNLLIVKVWSPWDREINYVSTPAQRTVAVMRNMIKGTYEHADTFVQRDVNPIGIWRPVRLIVHDGLRAAEEAAVQSRLEPGGQRANVSISWPVASETGSHEAEFTIRVSSDRDGRAAGRIVKKVQLTGGRNVLDAEVPIDAPRLWNTWDRGEPALYRAELEVREPGGAALRTSVRFGIRSVELRRSKEQTRFYLNGKPIYLRGTTYWPDVYISASDRSRYERDLAAAVRAGMNAVRVHVHVENPEFYEICDRMGLAVLQDGDLNWIFPITEEFTRRAVTSFGRIIRQLGNHPSIIGWIAMNEASAGEKRFRATVRPGPQLVAEAKRLDPLRPVIKNSGGWHDLESGDHHDYRGSLSGGAYTAIFDSRDKLVTEFGVDAPPSAENARKVPRIAARLAEVLPRVAELHDYQYRLIKYYIEHYRIQKYEPNAGYFQFMWIDFCPQDFMGVYDYWGAPKAEGIGGGLRALEESNQPVGIFMEYKDAPVALHAVNDLLDDLGDCVAEWTVSTEAGEAVTRGQAKIRLGPDSHVRIGTLDFAVRQDTAYRIILVLRRADGRELARNVYRDPFHHPAHPEGHPKRMDHEIGMRLWWAGPAK